MISSQLKHGEVLVVMTEVGLSEKIPPSWQEEGDLHQQLQKIREPGVLSLKRSHQRKFQTPGLPDLGQNLRNQAKRREGIGLEAVPRLKHGIRARRLRIDHRQEVNWKTVIEGSGEKVYHHRPTAKLMEGFGAEGPLGAEDLRVVAERTRQHIQLARDELRQQLDVMTLAQTKDGLCHRVEGLRPGAPLLLQVRQSRGVVNVKSNNLDLKTGEKTPDSVEHR